MGLWAKNRLLLCTLGSSHCCLSEFACQDQGRAEGFQIGVVPIFLSATPSFWTFGVTLGTLDVTFAVWVQ